jgi:hypothetical protein
LGTHPGLFGMQTSAASSACNVVRDWAGSCAITIRRRRDQRQGLAMKWDLPIRPIESGPLTDQEIKELDAFLLAEDLKNPMDFFTFDGFICAVLSGPNTIMPSQWLRWVWDQEEGEQPPEFTSEKQAKRILSLLIGHANVVAFTLTHGPQYYEHRPFLAKAGTQISEMGPFSHEMAGIRGQNLVMVGLVTSRPGGRS